MWLWLSCLTHLSSSKIYELYKMFDSIENIMSLIDLKEKDSEKYYTVIQYTNIMLNLLCSMLGMDQTIVLDPENLRKSYFLVIKLKK